MKPLHILLLLIVVAIWGINFVVIKVALQEMPPILLCCSRFFLVSFPAVFFFKKPSISFKWIALYGMVMFVLQFGLTFSGLHSGLSAGLASILLQTQSFFSILFARLFLNEKLNRWQWLGALISFSGIATVGLHLGSSATPSGLIFILLGAATWGIGSVIVKKMGKVQSELLLVWGSFVAWPPLLMVSFFLENSASTLLNFPAFSYTTYGAIFFIAFLATAFGFGIWNWLIQLYPIATVAPFSLLVPVFGMTGSAILLNESFESWKVLAGILVISGLCTNLIGSHYFSRRPQIDQ